MNSRSIPLTIAHLDDGREWRGGQRQVFLLVLGLEERGIRQWVLTPRDSPLAQRLKEAGFDSVLEYDGGLPQALRKLNREARVGIFHAHRGSAHRKALGVHRRLRREMASDQLPAMLSTRRVDFAVKRNFISRRNYRDARQHYIAISTGVRDVLIEGGVSPDQIDVVHSGVPPLDPERVASRETMRQQLQLHDDEIAIGNVGALTDHKGQKYLIDAVPTVVERFPKARFLIFGEGELEQELSAQIQRLGLEARVRLAGYLPDIREKLAGLDVYVHPSHLEGLGTSILDAMLAGLPVVAVSTGGVPDIITPGENGLLAAPRDSSGIAECLIRLLAMTASERGDLAERGRERARSAFAADAMVEGTLAVYRKLTGNGD